MNSPSSTDTVDRQLRELGDRQAITELILRIGAMLDDKRFEDARAIFTGDVAVTTPGGSASGIDAVLGQARRNHAVRTQHLQTNVLIDLDGDTASARANLIAIFDDTPDRLAVGARYRFGAARTADGWRLTRMEIEPVWSTGPLPAQNSSRQLNVGE